MDSGSCSICWSTSTTAESISQAQRHHRKQALSKFVADLSSAWASRACASAGCFPTRLPIPIMRIEIGCGVEFGGIWTSELVTTTPTGCGQVAEGPVQGVHTNLDTRRWQQSETSEVRRSELFQAPTRPKKRVALHFLNRGAFSMDSACRTSGR